jgi:hypothetical protein
MPADDVGTGAVFDGGGAGLGSVPDVGVKLGVAAAGCVGIGVAGGFESDVGVARDVGTWPGVGVRAVVVPVGIAVVIGGAVAVLVVTVVGRAVPVGATRLSGAPA